MRPGYDAEEFDLHAEHAARRQAAVERAAAIEKLAIEHDRLTLEIFLEERAAYRQLVRTCSHRGVRAPVAPRYYGDAHRRTKASASTPTREAGRRSAARVVEKPGLHVRRIIRPGSGQVLGVY
jgi:hypothetical protein